MCHKGQFKRAVSVFVLSSYLFIYIYLNIYIYFIYILFLLGSRVGLAMLCPSHSKVPGLTCLFEQQGRIQSVGKKPSESQVSRERSRVALPGGGADLQRPSA